MRPVAVAVLVALAAGCAGDRAPADDGATIGSTAPPAPVSAPELPAPSPAGTGVVVVGGSTASFAVTDCRLSAPADGPTPTLVSLTGAGTTAGGIPFTVEVQRTATSTVAQTFTDTVTYADTARILQLQRFEVDGEITDLREPSARGTLLRVRSSGLSASGIGGPPGSVEGDDGTVGMAVDATCA